jgi:hypothetical protein
MTANPSDYIPTATSHVCFQLSPVMFLFPFSLFHHSFPFVSRSFVSLRPDGGLSIASIIRDGVVSAVTPRNGTAAGISLRQFC